jgi:hypothetical protein
MRRQGSDCRAANDPTEAGFCVRWGNSLLLPDVRAAMNVSTAMEA